MKRTCFLLVALSLSFGASADEAVWICATNKGDWTASENWKGGVVPEADGTETIRFSEGKGTSVVIPYGVGPDELGPYAYQLVFDASHIFAITVPTDVENDVEFDIYGGGVSATTTNKCTYTVNVPTYFYNADTQTVHVGSSATLGFNRTVGFYGTTLHKTGPGTLRFSKEMSGGTLLVSEGTATLYNASAVWTGDVLDVAGGTLVINSAESIPVETVLAASGAGLISVKSGVSIDVSSLTLDGTPCAAGVWGGIGSGMPYESAHITGGYIRVNCFGDKGIWNWSTGRGTDPAAPALWTDITNWKGAEAPGGEGAVARFDEPESASGPLYVKLPDTQLKLGELRANVEPVVFTNGNLYLGRTDTVSPQIWSVAGTRFYGDIEAKGAGVWWSTGSPDGSTNGDNRVSLRVNGDFELCGKLSLGTSSGRVLGVYDGTLMQRLDLMENPESFANGIFAVYLSTRGGYGITAPRGGLSSNISLDGVYCGTPTSSQRGIVLNKYEKGDNLVCVLKSGFAIDSGVNTAIKINTDPGYEPGLLLIAPAIDTGFAGPIVFNSDNVNVGFASGAGRGYEQPTARIMFKGGSSGWKARVTMRDDGGSPAMRTIAVSNWTGTIVKDGPNRFSSRAMETPGAAAGAVVEEGDWEMVGAGAKESIFATLAISNGARLVAAHGLRFGATSFRPDGTLQLAGRSTFTGTFAPARLEADIAPTLAGLGRIDVTGTLDLSRGGTVTITGYEEDLAPGTYTIATGTTVTGGGAWTVVPPDGSDFAYSVSTDGALAVTVARKDLTISSGTALATVKYARNVTLATTPGATNRVTGRNVRGFLRRGIDSRLYTRSHHNSIKMYSKENTTSYNKSWNDVKSSFVTNWWFWAKDADLSSYSIWNYAGGVKKPATLLSRRHVTYANHFPPGSAGAPANTQVTFRGTNGVYYTYQTVGARNIGYGDVAMAGLSEEVNENVVPGRILPGDWEELLGGSEGLPVATFDQLDHLSVHTLVNGFTAGYPDDGRRHDYTEYIYQGDSGHPRYMLCGNESINICHLTSGVTGSGTSRHVMTNELQTAMDAISDECEIPRCTLGRFDFTPYFGRLDAQKLTVSGGGTARLEAKLASVPDLELDNSTLALTATDTVSFAAIVAKGETCRLVIPSGATVTCTSQSVAPGTDFRIVSAGRDPGVAQTVTWVGPATGGVWSDPSNWQDGSGASGMPLADDTVVFPSGTADVTLDVSTGVAGVRLGGAFELNGTATLTLGAGGLDAAAGAVTVRAPLALPAGDVPFAFGAGASVRVKALVSLGGSARLSVPVGQTLTADDVSVDGTPVGKGVTYVRAGSPSAGTEAAWIVGDGAVYVKETAVPVTLDSLGAVRLYAYTNAQLSVRSDHAATVTVTLRDADGEELEVYEDLHVAGGGALTTFDLGLPAGALGKVCTFEVTPEEGAAAATSLVNAGWQTNLYCRADASSATVPDEAVYENGAWDPNATPDVSENAFRIGGAAVFNVTDTSRIAGSHRIVRFESALDLDDYASVEDVTNGVTGALCGLSLVTNESENAVYWMVLTEGTNWMRASGTSDTALGSRRLGVELDFNRSPAKIRYALLHDAGLAPDYLNVDGVEWLTATNGATTVADICFDGQAAVETFDARLSSDALAEVGGTEYADFAAALAAAGDKKVVLFTNLALSPFGLPPGTYVLDRNGNFITPINVPGVAPATEGGAVTVGDDTLEISSGTFVAEMSDGVFAQDGNLRYFTLNAAAAAVTNGATVFLLTDDLASSAVFAKENVTLDMRGHTLAEADPDTPVVSLVGDGNKLTVTGWGVVTGMHTSAFSVRQGSTLVLDGIIVSNAAYNAGKEMGNYFGDAVACYEYDPDVGNPTVIVSNGWFQASITSLGHSGTCNVFGGYFAKGNGYVTDPYDERENPEESTMSFYPYGFEAFLYGGVFTEEEGVNPEELLGYGECWADGYMATRFAVPVTTNGHEFVFQMMHKIGDDPVNPDPSLVYSVQTEGGQTVGGVQIPNDYVKAATGVDPTSAGATAQADLNTEAAYSSTGSKKMKKWHCYVLGMPASAATIATTEGPYVSGVQDANADKIGFRFATADLVKAAESGCKVEYEVIECSDPSGTPTGVTSGRVNYDESAKIANPTGGAKYYKMKVYVTPKQ